MPQQDTHKESKLEITLHKFNKESTKLADESKRFGAKINDARFREVDIEENAKKNNTFGIRLADKVAKVGGSWGFVVGFVIVLVIWMSINVLKVFGLNFDPYPFILLNLFLSCISAIQAPIIMMSQNRQADQDKLERDNDAKTNKKTEAEIELVHSKLDHIDRKLNLLKDVILFKK